MNDSQVLNEHGHPGSQHSDFTEPIPMHEQPPQSDHTQFVFGKNRGNPHGYVFKYRTLLSTLTWLEQVISGQHHFKNLETGQLMSLVEVMEDQF